MKKIRIAIALAALTAVGSASALEPTIYYNQAFSSVSANGQWVVGAIDAGAISILNLSTGKSWKYYSNGGAINYFVGMGKVVSNNGVVIGATKSDNACYWENGQWKDLSVPRPDYVNNTGSITPDGSVICGGVGLSPMSIDATEVMLGPAVWYRQPDGSYGDAVRLPYPKEDFSGRLPQYVTAVAISDDGKVVSGQIVDYTGFVVQPIVYICDDNGNWQYKLFGESLINPGEIQFPEWPGDFPEDILMPTPEWYMTQEQIDAFMEAFEEWDNTGTPPLYQDFMTPEQIAEYNRDMEEYLSIAGPWNEKYEAFMEVYYNIIRGGSSFLYNNERLSPDGKYYLTTVQMKFPGSSRATAMPLVFDIATGDYQYYDVGINLVISDMTEDYTILAYTPAPGADIGTRTAYLFPQMRNELTDLYDFMGEIDPSLSSWMLDNMLREVAVGVTPNEVIITDEQLCSGVPVATPDLGLIVTSNSTLSWMDFFEGETISFIMPTGMGTSGITVIPEAKTAEVAMLAGGVLHVSGNVGFVEIYDLSGRKVFSIQKPAEGTVNTGVEKGIYIIRYTDGNGESHESKVMVL